MRLTDFQFRDFNQFRWTAARCVASAQGHGPEDGGRDVEPTSSHRYDLLRYQIPRSRADFLKGKAAHGE
jgi:hypothetical protein